MRRKRRPAKGRQPRTWGRAALQRACPLAGHCTLPDGRRVPVLAVLVADANHLDLDAGLCRAGFAVFIRPLLDSDEPPDAPRFGTSHVLVRQVSPGVRHRSGVDLVPASDLN